MSDAKSSPKQVTMPAGQGGGLRATQVVREPARMARPAPSAVFVLLGLLGVPLGALVFSIGAGEYDGQPAMVIGGIVIVVGVVLLAIGAYRLARALDFIAAERWNSTIED